MKQHFSFRETTMKRIAFAAATALGVSIAFAAKPRSAAAQEIQLTGPLAGAPSVRNLRLHREGRVELAIGPGFTLLDEYQRTIFASGRLNYNLTDWLGIGVFGGYGAASLNTDLTDRIDVTAPRNSRTATNIPPANGPSFASQTGKLKFMAAPQVIFSPFRGKLALFQKLFVDTDLYLHGGAAFVGVDERKDCTACTDASAFDTQTRIAIAPTFGLGLTLYTRGLLSVNLEYRAFPLLGGWNRSGYDTRGAGPDGSFPDNQVNEDDRTGKFNQMVFIGLGFSLPASPTVSP